jgi:hypothetical protein
VLSSLAPSLANATIGTDTGPDTAKDAESKTPSAFLLLSIGHPFLVALMNVYAKQTYAVCKNALVLRTAASSCLGAVRNFYGFKIAST